MITEFTCGAFIAKYNECGTIHWQVINSTGVSIAIIDGNGKNITNLNHFQPLSAIDLSNLTALMHKINYQYVKLYSVSQSNH